MKWLFWPALSICPEGFPGINVTLTWTDSDSTKKYLQETFTNGETIEICADVYRCIANPVTTTTANPNPNEFWVNNGGGGAYSRLGMYNGLITASTVEKHTANVGYGLYGGNNARLYMTNKGTGSYHSSATAAISTLWATWRTLGRGTGSTTAGTHNLKDNQKSGQITTNAGVTISWAPAVPADFGC